MPDYRSLRRDDLQIPVDQPVAIRGAGRGKDAFLHPHLDADTHRAGVVGGLHLGESAVDLRHLFRGHFARVDVLLLEADGDPQPEQFSDVLDMILGIPGEARHGFDQYPVDLPGPAVRQHPVEVVTILRIQTADAFIGVNVDQFPVLTGGDKFGVVIDLGDIGIELIIGVAADAGVGRYPESGLFRYTGVDDCDPRSRG